MKTLARTLLAVTALGLPGAAVSDAAEPWMQAYYYRFERPEKAAARGAIEARIEGHAATTCRVRQQDQPRLLPRALTA